MKAIGLVGWLLVALTASAQPIFVVPETIRVGTLVTLYGAAAAGAPEFRLEVRSATDQLLARVPSLVVPGTPQVRVAWLALEASTPPGVAHLRFVDAQGRLWQEFVRPLVRPDYRLDQVRLDQAQTSLRADPDAQKDREAREIWAIYQRFDSQTPPWPMPLRAPLAQAFTQSAGFGDQRRYLYADQRTQTDQHRGLDYACPEGTPVSAVADGLIRLAQFRRLTGGTVVLEWAPGCYSVVFHLSTVEVHLGQRVTVGQRLGLSGKTGLATGPHLHWEIRCQGVSVDPEPLLQQALLDTASLRALLSSIEQKRG